MKTVAFQTLGCKVNQYDTEAMRELFIDAGYEEVAFSDVADVYIINTCTVTQTGDKKSRQAISRANAVSPNAIIAVTGCYAQRAPEEVLSLLGVNLVVGTKERSKIVELVEGLTAPKTSVVTEISKENVFENLTAAKEGRTRAHLKIQEGCDRFCTYCIIPYARGPVRSRPLQDVRRELEELDRAGFVEVVLTGIHLMSYGKDLGEGINLKAALMQADGLINIKRIRLGSLEPQLMDDDFIKYLATNERICHQFHLSLQSGSDSVLARMKRRYTSSLYKLCADNLRDAMPDCAITTDIIAGFPGETEEEFLETLEFAEAVPLSRIHAFPYSRRLGTKAYSMPNQLPRNIKAERARQLVKLSARLETKYMESFLNKELEVLFEEQEGEYWVGYTSTYIRVKSKVGSQNSLQNVLITGLEDNCLIGEIKRRG